MTNKTYLINVGVDISKLKLDVALSDQQAASFDNNQKGFECFLKGLKNQSETRVVMEATGGYEKPLARFLHSQGIAVSIVNAKRVRDYAKALGKLAKNDRIDAEVIRLFAEAVDPSVMATPSDTQQSLDALVHRREQLVKQRAMEKQHLETVGNKEAVRSIKRTLAYLDKEIKRIEQAIKALIDAEPTLTEKVERLSAVKGIGDISALTLIADLPELGLLTNQERQHFSRKLKWGPSDFSSEKFAGGYCLRRPAFVLCPPRHATPLRYAARHGFHNDLIII
jgi:transposase